MMERLYHIYTNFFVLFISCHYVSLLSFFRQMVTGSYSRRFGIYSVKNTDYVDMLASRAQPARSHRSMKKNTEHSTEGAYEDVDFAHKVMHVALHPKQNILAVTSLNNLFIFS